MNFDIKYTNFSSAFQNNAFIYSVAKNKNAYPAIFLVIKNFVNNFNNNFNNNFFKQKSIYMCM